MSIPDRDRIRAKLDAIFSSWAARAVVSGFVLCLIGTVILATVQNVSTWADIDLHPSLASIDVGRLGMVVGTVGTASAFMAGLYVAERNYRRERKNIPHLTMQLHVDRVTVSSAYDAIIITLEANNTGSGLCKIRTIEWEIDALAPYDDGTVEAMRTEFVDRDKDQPGIVFPWRALKLDKTSHRTNIEPGETDQLTYDFPILHEHDIEAIVVSAWVWNASEPRMSDAWFRRKVHVLKGGQDG